MRHMILITTALLLAACAATPPQPLPSAAPASGPVPVPAGCTAPAEGAQAKTPFIYCSAVFFPGSTAHLDLYQKYKYPDATDGVQLTYRAAALPEAKIDFFVFVLGRGPEDKGLDAGMKRVRAEISAATKAGMYADTVFGPESPVQVEGAGGGTLPGRRLSLTYDIHGQPYVSAGYVFYKQLYLVELRITAPASVGADALERTGDLAAAEAVPKIRLLNLGDCETLEIDMGEMSDPNQVAKAVARSAELRIAEGCPPSKQLKPADVQPKEGEDMLTIGYSASDW